MVQEESTTRISFWMILCSLKCFKETIFWSSRRLIGFDGCFLKDVYSQLLVVVFRDRNNKMLPIASAVVDVENRHTWTLFLEIVNNYIYLGKGKQLCNIINMQKVITNIHLTISLLLSFTFLIILFCYVCFSRTSNCFLYCIDTRWT